MLQGPGQERRLGDGLGSELRVDAGASQEEQLLHVVAVALVDHVELDLEVLMDELGLGTGVGKYPADLCSSEEDVLRAFLFEERGDGPLVAQIQLLVRPHDEVVESLLSQPPHDGGPHHAPVAGDIDTVVLVHYEHQSSQGLRIRNPSFLQMDSRFASSRSDATISLTIASKVWRGFHPSSRRAFDASPSSSSTSVGRR